MQVWVEKMEKKRRACGTLPRARTELNPDYLDLRSRTDLNPEYWTPCTPLVVLTETEQKDEKKAQRARRCATRTDTTHIR
ncbi:protocadherin-9-like [Clarias magur]|uniref:Protocadherin-9-like n=1 Tax=Clarias magur TaxID=1594786 RepID=A0A8J4TIM0_CLAMG|nr:protocadherin-9-like [Clarias magur]